MSFPVVHNCCAVGDGSSCPCWAASRQRYPAVQAPARGTLGGAAGRDEVFLELEAYVELSDQMRFPWTAELVVPKSHAAPGLCLRALPPPAA